MIDIIVVDLVRDTVYHQAFHIYNDISFQKHKKKKKSGREN